MADKYRRRYAEETCEYWQQRWGADRKDSKDCTRGWVEDVMYRSFVADGCRQRYAEETMHIDRNEGCERWQKAASVRLGFKRERKDVEGRRGWWQTLWKQKETDIVVASGVVKVFIQEARSNIRQERLKNFRNSVTKVCENCKEQIQLLQTEWWKVFLLTRKPKM